MQALVITAYQNQELLEKNLILFSKYFRCYVHVDRKSELNNPAFLEKLNSMHNVTVISRYKINWGSYLHMMAILDLLKMAVQEKEITRVHIISGEDFPVRSFEEFEKFFEVEHRLENFIECTDIRNMPKIKLRYEKFHFLHILNRKSRNLLVQLFDKGIRRIQYQIPLKRKTRFDYKGLVWSSLSIEAVYEIIRYLTPERVRVLKYCEIAEEFMVQNALMSSELKDTVVMDKKRYDDWNGCLTGPKVLGIQDYKKIKASTAFFARKIQDDKNNQPASELYHRLYEEFV